MILGGSWRTEQVSSVSRLTAGAGAGAGRGESVMSGWTRGFGKGAQGPGIQSHGGRRGNRRVGLGAKLVENSLYTTRSVVRHRDGAWQITNTWDKWEREKCDARGLRQSDILAYPRIVYGRDTKGWWGAERPGRHGLSRAVAGMGHGAVDQHAGPGFSRGRYGRNTDLHLLCLAVMH